MRTRPQIIHAAAIVGLALQHELQTTRDDQPNDTRDCLYAFWVALQYVLRLPDGESLARQIEQLSAGLEEVAPQHPVNQHPVNQHPAHKQPVLVQVYP